MSFQREKMTARERIVADLGGTYADRACEQLRLGLQLADTTQEAFMIATSVMMAIAAGTAGTFAAMTGVPSGNIDPLDLIVSIVETMKEART